LRLYSGLSLLLPKLNYLGFWNKIKRGLLWLYHIFCSFVLSMNEKYSVLYYCTMFWNFVEEGSASHFFCFWGKHNFLHHHNFDSFAKIPIRNCLCSKLLNFCPWLYILEKDMHSLSLYSIICEAYNYLFVYLRSIFWV